VAGALADNHRAILLGSKSYGESVIESLIPLKSGGAIRLTTARFATPAGHPIDGKGLKPDLEVGPLKLEQFAEGDIQREADLPGALKNPNVKPLPSDVPPGTTPAEPRHPAAADVATADIGSKSDEQLTQAEDVLRGLARIDPHSGG
jgi:carboxyl-terminal processing protease